MKIEPLNVKGCYVLNNKGWAYGKAVSYSQKNVSNVHLYKVYTYDYVHCTSPGIKVSISNTILNIFKETDWCWCSVQQHLETYRGQIVQPL